MAMSRTTKVQKKSEFHNSDFPLHENNARSITKPSFFMKLMRRYEKSPYFTTRTCSKKYLQ